MTCSARRYALDRRAAPLTPDELRGHVLGLFFAGNETTGAALRVGARSRRRTRRRWSTVRREPDADTLPVPRPSRCGSSPPSGGSRERPTGPASRVTSAGVTTACSTRSGDDRLSREPSTATRASGRSVDASELARRELERSAASADRRFGLGQPRLHRPDLAMAEPSASSRLSRATGLPSRNLTDQTPASARQGPAAPTRALVGTASPRREAERLVLSVARLAESARRTPHDRSE